jgi:hypothetical protein
MQVPENDVTWTFSLLNASESKASARTGTPDGFVSELVGIDGTNNGGITPFAGFREMYRFTPENTNVSYGGIGWAGDTNPYVTYPYKAKVVDFWSFSVVAGSSTRVWGFVYVVRRPNVVGSASCNNVYDLLMAFNAPNGSTVPQFRTVLLQQGMTDGGVLADQGNAVMSVETTSKAVYVFRRGVSPIAVYFKVASTSSTIATVINPAGPGKRVKGSTYGSGTDGAFSASSTHTSASLPDPTVSATNPPCTFIVCSHSNTSGTNINSIPNITTSAALKAGSYSFAVQLEDSKSGRKSQLSNNVDVLFTGGDRYFWVDGVYDSNRFDTLNVYRSVRTEGSAGTFTHGILQLEAQVTLSPTYSGATFPWASAPTYGTGSATFRYAYQLKDAALVMQDVFLDKPSYSETMPKGGAGALLDGTMLVGNISDSASDLTGTGETRWSASGVDSPELFTALGQYKPSNVGDAVTCFKRTGQIMAGLTRNGVQFFSKQDGFVKVLAAHQGYGVTGPYAAATVGPVTYYINYRGLKAIFPDGRLDDAQAINQLVGSEWYDGTTGAQELSDVSMAFDPATLCLYILNPNRRQAVQMWFATGVMSELEDMSFSKVTPGWWQDTDGGTNKNQLVPRALFLQNAPYPDLVTNTSYRPAVFMPSRSYSDKDDSEAGASQVSMFDGKITRNAATQITSGQATKTTGSYYDNTCTLQTGYPTWTISVNPFGSSDSHRMIGMWVYILWPFESSTRPSKFQVLNATSSTLLLTRPTYPTNDPLIIGADITPVGKTLAIDPVYVRVVTAPLRMSEDKAEEFIVKQPTSMGVVLSDVNLYNPGEFGSGAPQAWYWVGSLYRANETTPLAWSAPVAPDGTYAQYSIDNGDSPNWALFKKHSYLGQWFFPAFETFVPNVQYRLLGIQVKGRMLQTDRTRRTY